MDFLSAGIPLGRFAGITVRLHFTYLLLAFYQLLNAGNRLLAGAVLVAMLLCILLHEFGHALAGRWCDGEAEDILLWPLGGLAFVRPAWHPTAHLITTVAGPFVTLLLWIGLTGVAAGLAPHQFNSEFLYYLYRFVYRLAQWNKLILLFNLIPAFPMDGGRMLRDGLWHWLGAERATLIAVRLSQVIALAGVGYAIWAQQFWFIILAGFILVQSMQEWRIIAYEAGGTYGFSLKERLRRGRRQRAFQRGIRDRQEDAAETAFHRCAICGRTERDNPEMDFRVCSECTNGQEFCPEHVRQHTHA